MTRIQLDLIKRRMAFHSPHYFLTLFLSTFPFDSPENIRKPKVNIRRKVKKYLCKDDHFDKPQIILNLTKYTMKKYGTFVNTYSKEPV